MPRVVVVADVPLQVAPAPLLGAIAKAPPEAPEPSCASAGAALGLAPGAGVKPLTEQNPMVVLVGLSVAAFAGCEIVTVTV
jgi:hypothetical protein